MGPCMQMEIQYTLRAARGTDVRGKVHHTIHGLGPAAAVADRFEGGLAVSDVAVARVTQKPGLVLTTTSRIAGRTDETSQVVARMAALRIEAGRHASPFVTAGAFDAVFEGFIDVDVPGRYRFHADASGPLAVRVGDRTVLDGRGASSRISGDSVELLAGPTPIRIALRSNDEGALAFRLLWSGEGFAAEPVPPRVLRHQPGPTLVKHIALDEGRTLFATLSCAKCHEVPGGHATTGPSAMPELNDPTPALDAVGSRFTAPWMFAWMLDPHRLQRDPRMPDLFPGRDRDARRDAADIAAWLAGQTKEAEPILPESKGATAGQGRELFENLGCVACHDFERPDRADESRRHTLHFAAAKFKPGALSAYLEQPAAHHAATRMPEFGLSRAEAEALARYIRQRSRGKVSKLPDGADAARGRDAFIGRGCASCHQVAEQSITRPSHAPALDFGERTSDGCVADRPRSRAADFRLDAAQRDALRAFIAGEHGDSLQRVAAHQAAERAVVAAACTSCHDRDGLPSSRMELLVAEGRPDATLEVLPDLTWTGEKLRVPWTESLLMGKLDHRARPWMKARMPAFPSRAAVIARGLPHAHGVSQSDTSRPAIDAASARTGARVAMGEGSLACNQCHGVGALEAFGPFGDRGVNFAHVADRLRHDFYLRWMHAPERITPGTKMPTFAGAGGKTAATSIADGDASAQFAALWQWLETRPRSSRAFVRKWALSDLAPKIAQLERGRSFATGKALFSSMSCVQCHQIGGEGGTIGPDLSKISDKHAPLALLQEVLAPSKVIEDRYRVHTVFTKDDDIVDGMLLGEDARTLRILTNPLDPKSAVTVKKAEIDERRISATSPMPTDLLNTLKEAEVFDLLAYVLAGGDASHPAFRDR